MYCDDNEECHSYDYLADQQKCFLQVDGFCTAPIVRHSESVYCTKVEYMGRHLHYDKTEYHFQPKHDLGSKIAAVNSHICEEKCNCNDQCMSFDFQKTRMDCYLSDTRDAPLQAHGAMDYYAVADHSEGDH
eukprot:UN27369